jgi:Domain of unknown function (DUF4383)
VAHIPMNHRMQPLYRALAALAGLYILVFGIIGITRTAGDPLFDRGDESVFGLKLNLAFSIISVIAGAIILLGAIRGRNTDHFINLIGSAIFMIAGLLMMTLLRTGANFLNFQMATCIVSFIIGTVLLVAGLYGKTGPPTVEAHEENFRMHHGVDPVHHKWAFHGAPKRPLEDHPDGHRFA